MQIDLVDGFLDSALQFHGEVLIVIDVDGVDVQIQRSDLVHFLNWKMADRCLPPPPLDLASLQVRILAHEWFLLTCEGDSLMSGFS